MIQELGQISLYLVKDVYSIEDVISSDYLNDEIEEIKKEKNISKFEKKEFVINDCKVTFFYLESQAVTSQPLWLPFINERIDDNNKIAFESSYYKRANGVLFIEVNNRIFLSSFGLSGMSMVNKSALCHDFGIITAMNMCGNEELRQIKSSNHSAGTTQIDRQASKPSEAMFFGLDDTELLRYISGDIPNKENISLQGKDSLTIKAIKEGKFDWNKLLGYCKDFLNEYKKKTYKSLFPNYFNMQIPEEEKIEELDNILIEKLTKKDFVNIHLAIPEFISDDEYSFSYSNYNKRENTVLSYLDVTQLEDKANGVALDIIKVGTLKNKKIYAYSHQQQKILSYKCWSLYNCIVMELEVGNECFILSEGQWKKIDNDFYEEINRFVLEVVKEEVVDFEVVSIANRDKRQNQESIFNEKYCAENTSTILFDKAKLRIGNGRKDKEFCDILEIKGDLVDIIHVKKSGSSNLYNYLFSQCRFYCESFISDDVFLGEIRGFIESCSSSAKGDMLEYIKNDIGDVKGSDYRVRMWVLYNNKKPAPNKNTIPLMAKYELKITYERLKRLCKYKNIILSFIPVEQINFEKGVKKKA